MPTLVRVYPEEILRESATERAALSATHATSHENIIGRRQDAVSKLEDANAVILGPIITIVLGIIGFNQAPPILVAIRIAVA